MKKLNTWLKQGSYSRLSSEKALPGGFKLTNLTGLLTIVDKNIDFIANSSSNTLYVNSSNSLVTCTLGNVPDGTTYTFYFLEASIAIIPLENVVIKGWSDLQNNQTITFGTSLLINSSGQSVTLVKVNDLLWGIIANNGATVI